MMVLMRTVMMMMMIMMIMMFMMVMIIDTMPAFSNSPTHVLSDTQPTAFQHAGLPQHLLFLGLLSFSKFPPISILLFVIIDFSKYHREYNFIVEVYKSVLVLPLPDP